MKRVGLFGGTFDPVHLGHVAMVHAALREGIDHLVVMPCNISPHKQETVGGASGNDRFIMLRLAMPDDPRIEISRHEIDGPEISYTWQTLEYLGNRHTDSKLVLIIGMDQYLVLDQWARFNEWSQDVEFLVFNRTVEAVTGEAVAMKNQGLRVQMALESVPTVSASQVRDVLRRGDSGIGLIPFQVGQYIKEHGLYRR